MREYNSEVPKRPAYYEDHAKPAWISASMMAVAAAAMIIGGHFFSRRGGVPVAMGETMEGRHRLVILPVGIVQSHGTIFL